MRGLKRNMQPFYYALYQSLQDAVDSDGLKTGEKVKTYNNPVRMKANISPARGDASVEVFGKELNYTKVISTCNMNCLITEESILWIGKNPNTEPHNYVVVKIAKSLNSILYAVKEVDVL